MTNGFVNFGIHLTLDGYMAEEKKLNDMRLIFKILDELPEQIGMHKLHPPYVITAPPNDKKDPGGISGFVMIAESHISIHTFPKKRFVSIDVYTCQDSMESEKIISYFKAKLLIKETEVNQIKRGLRFLSLSN